jgi:hypothetical protein
VPAQTTVTAGDAIFVFGAQQALKYFHSNGMMQWSTPAQGISDHADVGTGIRRQACIRSACRRRTGIVTLGLEEAERRAPPLPQLHMPQTMGQQ